jgi:predicted metal-dependent HD superfamily phosphohydrolase
MSAAEALFRKVCRTQQDEWWIRIRTAYSEPQRHYHSLSHIDSMAQLYTRNASEISWNGGLIVRNFDWDKVFALAICFHDIVYEPKSSTNETDSIVVFQQFQAETSTCTVPLEVKLVETMIRCTINHQLPNGDVEMSQYDTIIAFFLDFDLQILGRHNPDEYTLYARQIRQEYQHYDDAAFRQGRMQVLRRFLLRPRFYYTETFFDLYDDYARANVKRELETLSSI